MQPGDNVQVTEYGGIKSTRRVVADRGATVEVCNEAEYESACTEGRNPRGVGFRRQYVVKKKDTKQ